MKLVMLALILSVCLGISWAQSSREIKELRAKIEKTAQDLEKQNQLLQRIPEDSPRYWEVEKQVIFLEILYDELVESLEKVEASAKKSSKKSSSKSTQPTPTPSAQAWLGISVEKIPESLRKIVGLSENLGLLVQSVQPESPAEKAGLQKLDILLACDGTDIQSMAQFGQILRQKKPQETLQLKVMQKGTTSELQIVLGQKQASNQSESKSSSQESSEKEIETFLEGVFEEDPPKTKNTSSRKEIKKTSKKTSSKDLLEEFTQSETPSTPDNTSRDLFNNLLEGLAEDPETQKALLDTAEKGLEQFLGKDQKRLVKNLRKQAESFMEDFEDPEQRERFLEDTEAFTQRFLGKNGVLSPEVQESLADFFGEAPGTNGDNKFNADYFLEQILAENPKELERLLKQLGNSKQTAGFRRFLKRAIENASERKKERSKLNEEIDALFEDIDENVSESAPKLPSEKISETKPIPEEKQPMVEEIKPLPPSTPKPYLGLKLLPISPMLRAQMDLGETEGVLVGSVEDPGPATTAGIQKGDILLSIQGNSVAALGDVARLLRGRSAGESLEMKINRKGDILTLSLVLGTKSE